MGTYGGGRTTGRALALERVRRARALREALGIAVPTTGHCIYPVATGRADRLCRIRDKQLGRLDEHTTRERRMPHMTAGTLGATEYSGDAYQSDLVPEDLYVLELLAFSEPKLSTFVKQDGKERHYLYATFRVVESMDGDATQAGKGFEDQAGYTLSKGPKGASKLRSWVEAFLGRALEPNEQVDLDALAAQHPRARAAVATKTVTKLDGTAVEKSYVEHLKPLKRTAKAILEEDLPF